MAEYVVVGGNRKHPVIDKLYHPQTSAQEKARHYLKEMKVLVVDTGAEATSVDTKISTSHCVERVQHYIKQSEVPDIPVNFYTGRD